MAQALPCIGRHYNIACMKRVRSAFVDGRHRVAGGIRASFAIIADVDPAAAPRGPSQRMIARIVAQVLRSSR